MNDLIEKKRLFVRHQIKVKIDYRILGEDSFQEGWLDNISASGVLFWCQHSLKLDDRVLLKIHGEDAEHLPIEIMATIVRVIPKGADAIMGYGCCIEGTKSADGAVHVEF